MNSIIGTWKLLSFKVHEFGEDGRVRYPYGSDVSGLLIYDRQGYMSETIAANTRPQVSAIDTSLMVDEEKMAIAEHFSGYAGKFEIQDDTILHHIEVSFHPNRTGTTQEKSYCFDDEKLILRVPPLRFGEKLFEPMSVWERAS